MINPIYSPAPGRYESGIRYRRCGRSGVLLPEIALGLWHNFGPITPLTTGSSTSTSQTITAGESLINDLQRLYGANGAMAIPWNMIVDTHGSIVQLHAPRPSDPVALSTALDTVD